MTLWSASSNSILPSSASESGASKSDTIQSAIFYTILSVAAAVAFGIATYFLKGPQSGVQFFTGYLVEESLSIDNLFVFFMLFDFFKIPYHLQNRVLTWGLIGAVILRGIMIVVGVSVLEKFQWITLVFAGILVYSSFKLFFEKDDDGPADLSDNYILKISRHIIKSTEYLDGEQFFTMSYGKKVATPLLMCLICVELSDVVFAVDSIPAVLGITHDPFIVYSSNIFAILGLRSLYVIISQIISKLKYIRPCVALVLAFIGLKMIGEYFSFTISSVLSLSIVCGILAVGVVMSLLSHKASDKDRHI